VRAH
jgi:alpha-tubulin suppressor-like RCC1 family protein